MKCIYTALLFTMLFTYGQAQNTLEGTITSSDRNEALPMVQIYFPQLEKGAVSDDDGKFTMSGLPSGSYKIVASYIGYTTYSKTISIAQGKNFLNIELLPSAIEMEEVIVSTPFHKLQRENVMKVERADVTDLKAKGAITLSDGITNVPGVESLSTGLGIGKPVIRGLSANRVLVYTQGVRLENQQFGDEHGLGVSDAGIESIEIIKGPASLLYGSDALGGVLYLNPEKFAIAGETEGDVNLNYFSNTNGLAANAGIKSSGEKFKYLVRGSVASHTDYHTGDDVSVTNSRFGEYDLKAGIGYQTVKFKTDLRYNYNNLELGIPEELGERTNERSPESPYQEINNHILSSKTNLFFGRTSLEAILGYTFNNRKEFEEGEEGAALDMDLETFNYNLQYHLPKWGGLESIVGVQGMHQTNNNYGEELLIPDATTSDFGIFGTSHLHFQNNSDLQLGLRYDRRSIEGKEHGEVGEEGYIEALDRDFNSFNAALGYKWELLHRITGRLNLASGFRAPNLAELTSNGVHEGTNRYEIGNGDLRNEQNVQTDLSLEYKNEHIEIFVNGFYNRVNDYIFIEPNGETIESDAVFAYQQDDAKLYGGEIGLHIHPHPLDWLHLESSFETVTGKLDDDSYLPLIPANSWTNTLRTEFSEPSRWFESSYAYITLKSVFKQGNISTFETETDGYALLNLGLGAQLPLFNQKVDVRISGNNILNTDYVSHLSRLKTDGISNIGRNINLGISVPF
ncbi:TonB-dependent receptor [Pseudozobellia thermophila]|uniref:Iron complex outermembrane recepter protein n=1 Tax=Pseudozobellia thermophila TaxID=192903 RepID=A0A1M6EZT6_9FLAO|nr:TonB-dependent receptor [Pseudozobellia thermophila]SHI90950.1 iron complex outermembrane recepter protein [Pseudozobellia thermophila]